ncbi:hypothetical protein [Phenylobacterium sp.]|jgi:hypothetical protein|uniref:hypothetical protein n=1 Tax=Phenylobacterium sp. TaxID=1871053 RepID=UPI002F409A16
MAGRLKVFVTSDGLTDFVVAASSRPKALAAWGVRQDLFREGLAHETDDPKLAAEARARPGEVLRRPAGSRAALARLKPPPKPEGPSKAALRKAAELRARLAALEAAHAEAETAFDQARRELEAEAARRRRRTAGRRDKLSAALEAAERALET